MPFEDGLGGQDRSARPTQLGGCLVRNPSHRKTTSSETLLSDRAGHVGTATHRRFDLAVIIGALGNLHCRPIIFSDAVVN